MIRYVKIVGLTLAGIAMKLPSILGAPFPRLSTTYSEEWHTEPLFQTHDTAREMDDHTAVIKILFLCFGVVIIIILMGYLGKKMADLLLESRKPDKLDIQNQANWKLSTSAQRYHFQHCALKMIEEERSAAQIEEKGSATQIIDLISVVSETSSIFENPNITTVLECPGLYGTLGMKESDELVIRNPLFEKG